MMTRWIVLLGLVGVVVGCAKPPTLFSPPEQWQGPYGGPTTAGHQVLRSPAEWTQAWSQVGREPPRALAPQEMAVIVFLGERPTGGYELRIDRLVADARQLRVETREVRPAPDAMLSQVLTAPWVIAVLPRSALPVQIDRPPAVSPPSGRATR